MNIVLIVLAVYLAVGIILALILKFWCGVSYYEQSSGIFRRYLVTVISAPVLFIMLLIFLFGHWYLGDWEGFDDIE